MLADEFERVYETMNMDARVFSRLKWKEILILALNLDIESKNVLEKFIRRVF